ncbi:hypothetical protein ACQKNS_11760 [Peribacillus sp. NPDC094092]|uniref:hypothetical protein n=1 Tax=Peribacillus sp. NPDC094092 TaxID=3390611 RepID=UPI003D08745F
MGYDVTFAGDAMGSWTIGVLLSALAFGVQTNLFKKDGRIFPVLFLLKKETIRKVANAMESL